MVTDNELKKHLVFLRNSIDPDTQKPLTWERIKTRELQAKVSRALLWKIVNIEGYTVKDKRTREALELETPSKVFAANGQPVAPGSQVLGSQPCIRCQRPFISNHPRRKKCFICSKYRGKKG